MNAPPLPHGPVRLLEECALNAWPAHHTLWHAGWVVRANGGFTKRANSACALDDQGDLQAALAAVQAHYGRLGQAPVFRITPLAPAGADAALQAAGFVPFDPAWVMTANLAAAQPDARVHCHTEATAAWLDGTAAAQGYPPATWALHHATVRAIVPQRACATLVVHGQALAYGLGVLDRGWLGLFDLVVSPGARGQGLGTALVRALLHWGHEAGAHAAYLQVREANPMAERLYARLGFARAYRYHYRVPPDTPGAGA